MKTALRLVVAAVCATGLFTSSADASTILVNSSADNKTDDGQCTLREAIDAANTNTPQQTVMGADCPGGESSPAVDTIDLSGTSSTITLSGAAGNDNNTGGDLDVNAGGGPVTIQGVNTTISIIRANNVDRAFDFLNSGNAAILDNVRVADGLTTGSGRGGAIRSAANLTVSDSEIQDSEATGSTNSLGGGGIAADSGSLTVLRTEIVNNSVIHNTAANAGYGVTGGGIAVDGASPATIVDSTIQDNHVNGGSSGAFQDAFPSGGGISHRGTGSLTVLGSSLLGNDLVGAENRGGAGISFAHTGQAATMNVHNSTFAFNDPGTSNGPFGSGGGINAIGGTSRISFSTFTDNAASADQGASIVWDDGAAAMPAPSFTVRNSIFDEGGTNECQNPMVGADYTSLGGNVERGSAGADNECEFSGPSDALQATDFLSSTSFNGGLTETAALTAGAAAIDRVAAPACLDFAGSPVATDQRGFARGSACDSGAFEFGSAGPPVDPPDPPAPVGGTGSQTGSITQPGNTSGAVTTPARKCKKPKKKGKKAATGAKKPKGCKKKKKK